jgi:hypothetical protein
MERYFLIFIVFTGLMGLPSCQSRNPEKTPQESSLNTSDSVYSEGPHIDFGVTEYNFGRVYEGEIVGWYFTFENKGNKSLILTNVSASCGCTTPEYSKEPVLPGSKGEIKVVFDTNGRTGNQFKTVSVETNSNQGIIELKITAEVVKK